MSKLYYIIVSFLYLLLFDFIPNIFFWKDSFDHDRVSLTHKLLVISFYENNFLLEVNTYYEVQWGLCDLLKINHVILYQIVIAGD